MKVKLETLAADENVKVQRRTRTYANGVEDIYLFVADLNTGTHCELYCLDDARYFVPTAVFEAALKANRRWEK